MAQFGFGGGGRGANVGIDIGAIRDFFTPKKRRPEEAALDPEFAAMLKTGTAQLLAGESPDALIDARAYLMKNEWGPKSSQQYIENAVNFHQQALQNKNFNQVLQENAAVPEQTTTTPVDMAEVSQGLTQEGVSPDLQNFMRSQDQDEAEWFGGGDTQTQFTSAQPEKAWTQNQLARVAGAQGFGDISKGATFMQAPQQQAHQAAQTSDVQSQTKTREGLQRIEDLREEAIRGLPRERKVPGEPSDFELALMPVGLANRVPQREKVDSLEPERRANLEADTTLKGAQTETSRANATKIRNVIKLAKDPSTSAEKLTTEFNAAIRDQKSAYDRGDEEALSNATLAVNELRAALLARAKKRNLEEGGQPAAKPLSKPGSAAAVGAAAGGAVKGLTGDGPGEMTMMPDPKMAKDRILRETTTGKRYKSDGTKWIEIKKDRE